MVASGVRPRLVPRCETFGEELRKPRSANQRLCSCNVIGNASPLHCAERANRRTIIAAIPQYPARSYITVARLPNGTDIDE